MRNIYFIVFVIFFALNTNLVYGQNKDEFNDLYIYSYGLQESDYLALNLNYENVKNTNYGQTRVYRIRKEGDIFVFEKETNGIFSEFNGLLEGEIGVVYGYSSETLLHDDIIKQYTYDYLNTLLKNNGINDSVLYRCMIDVRSKTILCKGTENEYLISNNKILDKQEYCDTLKITESVINIAKPIRNENFDMQLISNGEVDNYYVSLRSALSFINDNDIIVYNNYDKSVEFYYNNQLVKLDKITLFNSSYQKLIVTTNEFHFKNIEKIDCVTYNDHIYIDLYKFKLLCITLGVNYETVKKININYI